VRVGSGTRRNLLPIIPCSESSLAAIEDRLMTLINGSLHSFLGNLCSTHTALGDILEGVILEAAEVQRSARNIKGEVLQAHGVGDLLSLSRGVSARVATVITSLEDLLLADMEDQVESLYCSKKLLYQTVEDICYRNSVVGL
jgi:hypothetical protein